jgi:hypothetical protein
VAGNDPKQLGKYSCPLPFPMPVDCPFALYKDIDNNPLAKPVDASYERNYIALVHTWILDSSCALALTSAGEWRMQCASDESALKNPCARAERGGGVHRVHV